MPSAAPTKTLAIAAQDESGVLAKFEIERRALGPKDVKVTIKYCGMCHSDLHQMKGEWGDSKYPMVRSLSLPPFLPSFLRSSNLPLPFSKPALPLSNYIPSLPHCAHYENPAQIPPSPLLILPPPPPPSLPSSLPSPQVPGHEIVGLVEAVGKEVTSFTVGSKVGVGVFVDSCRTCANCHLGDEQYCTGNGDVPSATFTYNFKLPDGKLVQVVKEGRKRGRMGWA